MALENFVNHTNFYQWRNSLSPEIIEGAGGEFATHFAKGRAYNLDDRTYFFDADNKCWHVTDKQTYSHGKQD